MLAFLGDCCIALRRVILDAGSVWCSKWPTIVGVKLFGTYDPQPSLFDMDEPRLAEYLERTREKLVLLSEPESSDVDDDF